MSIIGAIILIGHDMSKAAYRVRYIRLLYPFIKVNSNTIYRGNAMPVNYLSGRRRRRRFQLIAPLGPDRASIAVDVK